MPEIEIAVKEMPARLEVKQRGITVGLPKNPENGERRFPLTPEAVRTLVDDYGFKVLMEGGAGKAIHYTDQAYASGGAVITDRATTLSADIVITATTLSGIDVNKMRRNATLWTVLEPGLLNVQLVESVNQRAITMLSLTALTRRDGSRPIAETLEEIDGRAAMSVVAGFLADGVHGKGILLGGVAGIVPCEVVVIGAGIAGVAAARSAIGLGATVRMFDNDPCLLRRAETMLGNRVIGSSLHRNVYLHALASADVIINTLKEEAVRAAIIDSTDASMLKKGAILFDLDSHPGTVFPSMRHVDLSPALETMPTLTERICFVSAGSAVPRTSAMALSNAIVPLLASLAMADDRTFMDAVRMNSYLNTALVTFGGKLINADTAKATGLKWFDPAIFMRMS